MTMKTILLAVALLLLSTECFGGGSYDGYVSYQYTPPPYIKTDTYMGGSGITYFKYGDAVSIHTPAGMDVTYEVHQTRYFATPNPKNRVWICVNDECNNEFYRRRLPLSYTVPKH